MHLREADIYITRQLNARPVGKTNHLQEKQAIQELAQCMASDPEAVLPRFVDLALEITGAVAGGLSLLEKEPAPGFFHWRYLRGGLSGLEDMRTPRNYSPCGVTLDANGPVLAAHPERYYTWISDAGLAAPETLLVPLHLEPGEPLGTLWIVAATEGHFHRGHVRAMTELSTFVSAALRMIVAERRLKRELADMGMKGAA